MENANQPAKFAYMEIITCHSTLREGLTVGRKLRWVSFTIEGNDGDVYIRLADTTRLLNKKGLIVYGIDIRPTK